MSDGDKCCRKKKKSSSVVAHRENLGGSGGWGNPNFKQGGQDMSQGKKRHLSRILKRCEKVKYISMFSDYVHMFVYFV